MLRADKNKNYFLSQWTSINHQFDFWMTDKIKPENIKINEETNRNVQEPSVPSRTNCSDNCSPNILSGEEEELISVFILSSLPSQRPTISNISCDKLISAAVAFSDEMESIPPMQTSRSSNKLLRWEGMSNTLSWIIWQRSSKSTELTSVGLT